MIHISSGVRYDKIDRQAELDVSSSYFISVQDGWIHKERFLDLSELIFVTKGKLYMTVNGENVELAAGDAYLIRRYSFLSGSRVSEGMCSFYTVSFVSTLEKYNDLYAQVIHISSHSSYAQTLFNNLSLYSSRENSERFLSDASFLLLLEILFESRDNEPEQIQMQGIIQYINSHIGSPLSMEEISDHFHYSKDYIAKIFKEQHGVTIKQYIVQKKLSVAKRLLTTSDIPISLVGQAVGFSDVSLFEKFFKYHVKLTPRKYKSLYI
ncbi:MAG: helix-turn-helix domain-containing protein [Eubacteriales bacterium]